jgi:maleamate amidohydrolase
MNDVLQADYAQAGFGLGLPTPAPGALLLVDVARAYFERGSPLDLNDDALLARIGQLLAAARAARLPVLHTRVVYDASGTDGGWFYRKVRALEVFRAGSPLADFAAGMVPQAGEVVVSKQYASGFFGTSLASTLAAMGVRTLLIAGVSTSGCVRATAVDALQHGFVPVVVRDACGDRASGPHEANLFDLQAKYAEVMGLAAALALLPRLA